MQIAHHSVSRRSANVKSCPHSRRQRPDCRDGASPGLAGTNQMEADDLPTPGPTHKPEGGVVGLRCSAAPPPGSRPQLTSNARSRRCSLSMTCWRTGFPTESVHIVPQHRRKSSVYGVARERGASRSRAGRPIRSRRGTTLRVTRCRASSSDAGNSRYAGSFRSQCSQSKA